MEGFGVVVPEIGWISQEEKFQMEDSAAMEQLFEAQVLVGEQTRDLVSAAGSFFWPHNEAGAYYASLWSYGSFDSFPNLHVDNQSCRLREPSMSCEPDDSVMGGEETAATFFYADSCYQLEEIPLIPNETNANMFTEYNAASEQTLHAKEGVLQKYEAHVASVPPHSSKRKARESSTWMKKETWKKKTKFNGSGEEASNAGMNTHATSSCSSEANGSNASQELNEGISASSSSKGCAALNAEGKSRAGRGAATDPQSLYARRRRERINERLRILQNLVPNGTKVDISTMLEEAVQYVKFLQLQIKLLSSDELWMYAPIAYNGMNIGLDLIVPSNNH